MFGWVKNLPDGRVEVLFEGYRQDIEKIIEWCKKGPDFANVRSINILKEEYIQEFDSFIIIY